MLLSMATASQTPSPPDTASLGPDGEIRVPEGLRKRLGWREGDKLVLFADETGDVKILTLREAVRSVRDMLQPAAAGRVLANELIDERRREAERE